MKRKPPIFPPMPVYPRRPPDTVWDNLCDDYEQAEKELRPLARNMGYQGVVNFPLGLDLSGARNGGAGEKIVLRALTIAKGYQNLAKFEHWVGEDFIDLSDYHPRFTVVLTVEAVDIPYVDSLDQSFKLKGLLCYPEFWKWLAEYGTELYSGKYTQYRVQ